MPSQHSIQERDRLALESEDRTEKLARFAPSGRDWWQARAEDGLPTLAEEMSIEPDDSDDDSEDEDDWEDGELDEWDDDSDLEDEDDLDSDVEIDE